MTDFANMLSWKSTDISLMGGMPGKPSEVNSVYNKGLRANSAFCVLSVFILMTLKTITLLLLLSHTESNSRISGNPFQAKSASPYHLCYKLSCFSFIWVMNSPGVPTNTENSISRPQPSPCNIKCLMM